MVEDSAKTMPAQRRGRKPITGSVWSLRFHQGPVVEEPVPPYFLRSRSTCWVLGSYVNGGDLPSPYELPPELQRRLGRWSIWAALQGCSRIKTSKNGQSMLSKNSVVLALLSLVGLTLYGSAGNTEDYDMTTCLRQVYELDKSDVWPRKEEMCSCVSERSKNLPFDLAFKTCDDRVHGDIRRERERERIRREERFTERMLERSWDAHEKQMEQIQRNWNWNW